MTARVLALPSTGPGNPAMQRRTRDLLDALNRDFYEKHAADFASTRDHAWPGWQRVLDRVPAGPARVLDAGCGNGRFARFLVGAGRGDLDYTGIDTSDALLAFASEHSEHLASEHVAGEQAAVPGFRFLRADLFDEGSLPPGPFDAIVLFGVMHHVPGFDARVQLASRLASRLRPGGFLAATLWRFGSDARVVGRTAPWRERPDVDAATLEPGDHLLRWGDSDDVVRYCHFVDADEVGRLIERTRAAGLEVIDRFRSDGRSGELNEYLLWSRG